MAEVSQPLFLRLLGLFTARPDPDFAPAPEEIAEGLWVLDRRVHVALGMTLPCRSTVIQLDGGGLLVHSPPPLDLAARNALESLGPVRAVVGPNPVHHSFIPDYARAYPEAQVFLAPGLAQRVPGLPRGVELCDEPPPLWRGRIDQIVLRLDGLGEVSFLHRPSRTLILTDLSMNLVSPNTGIEALYWRAAGYPARFAPSFPVRRTILRDRQQTASIASRILEWPFERIVMCHGDIIDKDAPEIFRAAFSRYLPDPAPASA
ncbi:MAG: DUF4336 domain-containing protein [Myxococcota bacterium]|nr:DUF4336 domain-containing protein [Myxococcota bacterium]